MSAQEIQMILEGIRDTLYMTIVSTLFGYVIGLPWGIALTVTGKDGLRPNNIIYRILDVVTNIMRSIPFLILLILVLPLTMIIVGKTYGSTATIVPLVISASPLIARMVESSLNEVDKGVIEAAQSMDRMEGSSWRSPCFPDFGSNHHDRNDPWIFRNGRNRRRRRTGRYRNPLRILSVSGQHPVGNRHSSDCTGTDFPVHRNRDFGSS